MDQYPDISPEEFEAIESYLTGQLDAAQTAAFDKRLAAEPTLRAQTDEVRLLITGVREAALAERMVAFHQEMQPAAKVPQIGGLKRWLVAASIITLIGFGTWFAIGHLSKAGNLYQAYYEKDPGLLSAMGTTSDNYDFDRAMIDYKKGDNAAAISTWESQAKLAPANDTLNYFLGSAYLAIGQTAKAGTYFNKVIAHGTGAFLTEAYWYNGLALLKEGKEKEAIPMIEHSDRKEKDDLLKKIRK